MTSEEMFISNQLGLLDGGSVSCVSVFSKIGEEQSAEDAEDGPPELLVSDVLKPSFTHVDIQMSN